MNGDTASVDLWIPREVLGDRDSIELRFPEALLGREFLESVHLTSGAAWPNVFSVERGGVSIQYDVELVPRRELPAERVRVWSFMHPRGWHLKGYQLIPEVPVDAPALIEFGGDEPVLAPLPSVGPRAFHASHALELSRSSYEVGPLAHACARIGTIDACVASSVTEDVSAMLDLTARALVSNTARLGPVGARTVLLSHHARGPAAYGITIGSSITVFSPQLPIDAREEIGFVVIHELLHVWMPGSRSIRPLWLREGLTEYLAYLTVAEMTGASELEVAGWVSEAYKRYRAARYDIVIADTADELVYPAGVVAGFCLDRELGGRGSSTSEILRTLLAGAEDRSTTAITEDWFLAELSGVSTRAAGYFKLLISERRFNFSNCMLRAVALESR